MAKLNRRELGAAAAGAIAWASAALPASATGQALSHLDGVADAKLTPAAWHPILPGVWRATLGTPESHTPVRDRLIPPAAEAMRQLPAASVPPLPPPAGSLTRRGVHAALPLQPGELMYGFGLQLQSFQQRSRKRVMRVNADPLGDSGDSHAPVPFYVTTAGYGVLIDTFRHAEVNCGQLHPRPTAVQHTTGSGIVEPAKLRERDRLVPGEVRIEIPRTGGVDLYLFAGPAMLDAVRRYNLFSGGGVNPPEWGLGFWYRAEMRLKADEVLALAHGLRESNIPCDVLGLEPGWQTHAYSCSYAWEPTRFPHPNAFLQQVAEAGFHTNLWEHAFTHPTSPIFNGLQPHSGDYAVWDGLVPDFAGAPARKVFADYHASELIANGVSGFKLDECDGSDFTRGWSWPDFAAFPSGLDGEQMHAAFGLKYQHTVLTAFQQQRRETYSLVRSSGALAAPYPFVLYSDLYDHRQFVRGLINAGFSGLLWCPEVRDAVTEEDLLRRLQTVVFSPVAMVNAWYIRNPPWKQIDREANNSGTFAPHWQTTEARCREIVGWRMSLVPYLRAAFAKYKADGTPVFRSPVLDFPEDNALHDIDDQFMVGDRILIAPLFAGEGKRTVVLPGGTDWHDLWTGKLRRAGEQIVFERSYRDIPAFVRAGSVLPWTRVASHAADPASREITARMYGDGSLPWQGAGEDLEGMRLGRDGPQMDGRVTPATAASRPYRVTGWQRFG